MRYAGGMAIDRNTPFNPRNTAACAVSSLGPPSGEYPRQCPKCRSAYWDRPRTHPQRRPKYLGPRRESTPRT